MALGAQPAGDLESVHARKSQVEDDEVDASLESRVQGGGAVLPDLDLVPLPAQGAGQGFRDGCVVLGEQYTRHVGDGSPRRLNREACLQTPSDLGLWTTKRLRMWSNGSRLTL